jgi:hypothetical protein
VPLGSSLEPTVRECSNNLAHFDDPEISSFPLDATHLNTPHNHTSFILSYRSNYVQPDLLLSQRMPL